MATSFDRVFDAFLDKIEDVEFAALEYEDQVSDLTSWLSEALMNISMSVLMLESDLEKADFEMMEFEDDLTRNEIELVSMYMMVAYLDRKIMSLEHLHAVFGSNTEKWTDQKGHLQAMMDLREYWLSHARKICRNRSTRSNSYLGGQ